MKPAANTPAPLVLPIREEWDFDLGGCPEEELEHCCFYEYALELPSVKETVARWRRKLRRNPKAWLREGDVFANTVRDSWFGSPFRVLLDHPEFPRKHWLQIDPGARKQRVEKLPPYSTIPYPKNPPKYEGPNRRQLAVLQVQMPKWVEIKQETEALLKQFQEAEAMDSLESWLEQVRGYFSEQEFSDWQKRYTQLPADKLHNAARKLLTECKKRIQRRRREPIELIPYEIDWTLRPVELERRFGQWAEANRVHDPRRRSGGHATKASELLRALGAKRLLDYFRKHKGDKRLDYLTWRLHVGLKDFTFDQRKAAGRPLKPLYAKPTGWLDGEKMADEHIKELLAH